jgi:hypothetical protein
MPKDFTAKAVKYAEKSVVRTSCQKPATIASGYERDSSSNAG